MITNLTADDLREFEESIAEEFNRGEIPYPVHLESGNEEQLIDIFQGVKSDDWVFCSWRSHLKCLLKGVSHETLRKAIRNGHSMTLCFPEYRVFSSAIVGGVLPIAVGTALGIKRQGSNEGVHVFLGDMTASTGIFHECWAYSYGGLPIRFILEDNALSVCTPTKEVWPVEDAPDFSIYEYKSKWPHAGAGKRVQF